MKLKTKDGVPIIGVLERVYGVALADEFDDEGDPVYTGETKINWNTQEPFLTSDHNDYVFIDEEGAEHTRDGLVEAE